MIIRVSKLDGPNSNALSYPTVQFAFYITACCMSTRCWPSELSKRATWCMMEHSLQKRNWYLWRVCPAFLRCLTPESSKEFWRSPTFPGHLMPLSWNKNDFWHQDPVRFSVNYVSAKLREQSIQVPYSTFCVRIWSPLMAKQTVEAGEETDRIPMDSASGVRHWSVVTHKLGFSRHDISRGHFPGEWFKHDRLTDYGLTMVGLTIDNVYIRILV